MKGPSPASHLGAQSHRSPGMKRRGRINLRFLGNSTEEKVAKVIDFEFSPDLKNKRKLPLLPLTSLVSPSLPLV